jgi:hypothetical protein
VHGGAMSAGSGGSSSATAASTSRSRPPKWARVAMVARAQKAVAVFPLPGRGKEIGPADGALGSSRAEMRPFFYRLMWK